MAAERIRVLRVIARLNVGGPAIHVTLASRLDPSRYETRLLAGAVGDDEGDMEYFAREHGVPVEKVPGLGREIRAGGDLAALRHLARIVREWKPHVVHTHTAKAGTLGRLAAIAARPRPRIVHTFHGHVLEGYFSRPKQALFRGIERALARVTDRLVVPAPRLRDDLLALGVGSGDRYAVIPLGFELDRYLAIGAVEPGPFRAGIGAPATAPLVTAVGRLTAIKNHALLLQAIARMKTPAHVALVGDGELRDALHGQAERLGIGARVHFAGWRKDLVPVYRESSVIALSSDNEGTPVCLIEAFASNRPVVATAVGGVPDLFRAEVLSTRDAAAMLVPPRDPDRFAAALDAALVRPAPFETRPLAAGFTVERLLRDLDFLYADLLGLTKRS